MLGSPNLYRGDAPLTTRLKIDDLHAQLAPLDRYGVAGLGSAITEGVHALVRGLGARCAALSVAAAIARPDRT